MARKPKRKKGLRNHGLPPRNELQKKRQHQTLNIKILFDTFTINIDNHDWSFSLVVKD